MPDKPYRVRGKKQTYKFKSTDERTNQFGSINKCTYNRKDKFGSTDKHKYEFGVSFGFEARKAKQKYIYLYGVETL